MSQEQDMGHHTNPPERAQTDRHRHGAERDGRDGLRLNWRRFIVSGGNDGLQEFVRQAEIGEFHEARCPTREEGAASHARRRCGGP